VAISEAQTLTREIMVAQAAKSEGRTTQEPDFEKWHHAQRWLARSGCRSVVVPFATKIQAHIDAKEVRWRRDFWQILNVVATLAMMHQRNRERDSEDRIVATLEDYTNAYRLLFPVLVRAEPTSKDRGNIAVVNQLNAQKAAKGEPEGVSYPELADCWSVVTSTAHDRIKHTLQAEHLVNLEDRAGFPARLVAEAFGAFGGKPAIPTPEIISAEMSKKGPNGPNG
jgi:hypothetical protein